jgi:GT2 family glycosyltransferase
VCNYNGAAYLGRCLDALLTEELDEVLVVDNASTDASRELVARDYPGVRVLALEANDGPATARNAGMRAARNRWVLALDNDAVVTPGMLARLVAAAEARPAAVIVQPRSVFGDDPERVHYDGGAAHYAGLIALRNWYTPLREARGAGVVAVDVAVSVCLLLDRDAVLAAGGYDESFFILFEDLDLSYRLRLRGNEILSVEDALVLHGAGTAGISFRAGPSYPARRVFFHSRNRWLYMLKCFRWRTLVVTLPGVLLYELVWFGFALGQGGLGAWGRGKWAVLRQLRGLRARRRAAQAGRVVGDGQLLVGGPLTLTPATRASGVAGALAHALDGGLRAWWALARHLCR